MKTIEKILDVLAKNIHYTALLALAIILFAIYSDGLLPGVITALSALVGYGCIVKLGREYKKAATVVPASAPRHTAPKKSRKK